MFRNVSKALAVLGISIVCGSQIFAVTPTQLGRDCARFTMKSLIHLIRNKNYYSIKDERAKGTYQNMALKCVLNAVDLKTKEERAEFLKAGLDCLQSMDLKNGANVKGFDQYDCARIAMLKFAGIDILETALATLDQLQWGQKMEGSCNDRVLFNGLYLDSSEEMRAFHRKAASRACVEIYGNEEVPEKARLVHEILKTPFGCAVAMLVEKIFVFSPVYRDCDCTFSASSGDICDSCCHPDYYQPWLSSMEDFDAVLQKARDVEVRYYNERRNDDCCGDDCSSDDCGYYEDCCIDEESCVN